MRLVELVELVFMYSLRMDNIYSQRLVLSQHTVSELSVTSNNTETRREERLAVQNTLQSTTQTIK